MKSTARKTTNGREASEIGPRFAQVVAAFAKDRQVSREEGKGFGSGALKANGKIFAMISSKNEFVVKLPKKRVDELESGGKGQRFDPGHGRLMKEWAVFYVSHAVRMRDIKRIQLEANNALHVIDLRG